MKKSKTKPELMEKNLSSRVEVSFVIPNYNGKRFLNDCITSLYKQERGAFEVIIVDDHSEGNDVTYLKTHFSKLRNFRLIALKKHVGKVKADDIGLQNSRGEFIFFLNNDTVMKTPFIKPIVQFFKTHKKAAVAQAKILRMNTNNFDYAGDKITPLGFLAERARGVEDKGQFNNIEKVFSVKGAAMIVKKSLYRKLGGIDKDFTFGWEEPDYTWRAWLAGYETYFLPTITVGHYYGTGKKPLTYYIRSQIFYHGCRANIASLIKNLGFARLLYMLPLNLLSYSIISLLFFLKFDFPKSWAILRGITWAIFHIPQTLIKRYRIQSSRVISDSELFSLVGDRREVSYYFSKAMAYITGKPF